MFSIAMVVVESELDWLRKRAAEHRDRNVSQHSSTNHWPQFTVLYLVVSIGAYILDRVRREQRAWSRMTSFLISLGHFFRLRQFPKVRNQAPSSSSSASTFPRHHHSTNNKWPHEQPVTFPPSSVPASDLRNPRMRVSSFTHPPPRTISSNCSSPIFHAAVKLVPGRFLFRL
jgi:hypothetical protein